MAEPAAALHAVFGADISPLQKRLDEAVKIAADKAGRMQREFEKSGKGAEEFGRRAAKSIEPTGDAAKTLGERMKGAQGAIAAASSGLETLGQKGSPAIKGLVGAVTSLLSGGFTPLGIAIGAATALYAAFSAASSSATSSSDRLAESMERQAAAAERLVKLRSSQQAARQNVPLDVYEMRQREIDLSASVLRMQWSVSRMESAIASRESRGAIVEQSAREKLENAKAELLAKTTELAQLREEIEIKKELTDIEKARADAKVRAAEELRAVMPEPVDMTPPPAESMDPRTAEDWAAARVSALRARQVYEAAQRAQIEAGQAEAMFRAQMDEAERRWSNLNGEPVRPEESPFGTIPRRAARTVRPSDFDRPQTYTRTDYRPDAIRGDDALAGFSARMSQIQEGMMTIGQLGASTADSLSDSFANAFSDFASGTKSASAAMKAFAASFISDIGRMLARQLALTAITSGASALGLTWESGAGADPIEVDLGGIGASKAPTSQPRAMVVNSTVINSAPGTTARTEVAQGPGGPELRTFVEAVVSSDAERGGPISRTLERTHGLQRRGRR